MDHGARSERHRLDVLLAEVADHIDEIRSSRDRLTGLVQAVVSVNADLDLTSVLRHIAEAARTLLDADYAALGVLGDDDRLSEFIYVGIDNEQAERIGDLPRGEGILGLLISDPRPLRLDVLGDHPRSCGFPAEHPPMTSFLGVPITVRGRAFGNLYLTDKRNGLAFTEEDESLAVGLAAAAAVAIDNARLFDRAGRQQRWLEAANEITARMLAGAASDELLTLVVDRAHAQTEADETGVRLPDGSGDLVLTAGAGDVTASVIGERMPVEGTLLGAVFTDGVGQLTAALAEDDPLARSRGVGPVLAVPLSAGAQVIGVLSMSRQRGGPPFDPEDQDLVESFASQAALALEFTEARAAHERLVVLDDRDRIARDLHDLVIQRIFASGLSLEAVSTMLPAGPAATRIAAVVDELDDTIRDLRTTIFALQHHAPSADSLRAAVLNVVARAAESLGFEPELRITGEIDTRVDTRLGEQLIAAVTEVLSNVLRHAGASSVEVKVSVGTELVLEVDDDGKGFPAEFGRRSGLANLRRRAEAAGGSLELGASARGGARVVWSVPLP